MDTSEVEVRGDPRTRRLSTEILRQPSERSSVIDVTSSRRSRFFSKNNTTGLRIERHSKTQMPASKILSLLCLIIAILTLTALSAFIKAQELPADDNEPPAHVDLCEACRLVVSSFEKGMDETARGKHEGGDTSWEEKNLKSYPDSEVRLIEIQEKLCDEVKIGDGKAQCLSIAEDSESYVEEWWFRHRNKNVRLYDYLCISKTKHCCPKNAYGPKCQPCPPSDCNKHGHCDGSGTRSGTGNCKCDAGYSGIYCDECSESYYRIETTDGFNCRKCDPVCKNCYGPGSMNCTSCRDGYHKDDTNACVDVNECELSIEKLIQNPKSARICKGNRYCVNTDGSFRCADCHHACDGCLAYGPDLCLACSAGYKFDAERNCREVDEFGNFEDRSMNRGEDRFNDGVNLPRTIFFLFIAILSIIMMRSSTYAICVFAFMFVATYFMDKINLLNDNIRTF